MPTQKSQSSLRSAGQNPSITPLHEMPPELLQTLRDKGINLDSLEAGLEREPFVGIGHASGPSENQVEIDAWVAAGGMPVGRHHGRVGCPAWQVVRLPAG